MAANGSFASLFDHRQRGPMSAFAPRLDVPSRRGEMRQSGITEPVGFAPISCPSAPKSNAPTALCLAGRL
jgi:hypothetical protein